ncbi:MAG TPA: GNAT family N-acetyltransferase [Pyrinomonadaceae bacterium]|jgi:GNAT superfamily N-acetyltransferase
MSESFAISSSMIRAAAPSEAARLSELALRSKGHWDYDAEFLSACRAALTLTREYVASHPVYVLEEDNRVEGFYSLRENADGSVALEHLFVEPSAIGRGFGRRLWEHAVETARGLGFQILTIDSDPYAEDFYLRMGAVRVGEAASEVLPGRMLPLLHFDLKAFRKEINRDKDK